MASYPWILPVLMEALFFYDKIVFTLVVLDCQSVGNGMCFQDQRNLVDISIHSITRQGGTKILGRNGVKILVSKSIFFVSIQIST